MYENPFFFLFDFFKLFWFIKYHVQVLSQFRFFIFTFVGLYLVFFCSNMRRNDFFFVLFVYFLFVSNDVGFFLFLINSIEKWKWKFEILIWVNNNNLFFVDFFSGRKKLWKDTNIFLNDSVVTILQPYVSVDFVAPLREIKSLVWKDILFLFFFFLLLKLLWNSLISFLEIHGRANICFIILGMCIRFVQKWYDFENIC